MLKKICNIISALFLVAAVLACSSCEKKSESDKPDSVLTNSDVALEVIVTINPKVKLCLNSDDVVVSTEMMNEDAQKTYSSEEIIGKSYGDALKEIVVKSVDKGYLTDNGTVDIALGEQNDSNRPTRFVFEIAQSVVSEIAQNKAVNISATADNMEISKWLSSGKVDSDSSESHIDDTSESAPEIKLCDACGGTGRCARCEGDGFASCERCGGAKTEVCPRCGGEKIIDCPRCSGKGYSVCPQCDGDGYDGEYKCFACGGEGKNTCSDCGSTGKISCEPKYCNGTGVVECSDCHGTGTQNCVECNESGACPACNGSGRQDDGER